MILVVGLTTSNESSFSSQSKAKIMQYKLQLQTLKKKNLTMREYLNKNKMCCDLLGSTGYRVLEEDQILHILAGLGMEYNLVMVAITSKADGWTVQDVSTLLLSFESRLKSAKGPSINTDGSQPSAILVQRGQIKEGNSQYTEGGFAQQRRGDGGRGNGFRGGREGRGGKTMRNRIVFQLCKKLDMVLIVVGTDLKQNFMVQNAPQPRQQQQQ